MLLEMHQTYKVFEDLIVNHLAHQSPSENNFLSVKYVNSLNPLSVVLRSGDYGQYKYGRVSDPEFFA